MFSQLFLAITFLTILPAPQVEYRSGALGRAAPWFPLVGTMIGVLLLLAHLLLSLILPAWVTAVLIMGMWAALTGGLHLDGLADCCDGMLAAVERDRRLEIMKDPRLGSFGVIGLVLILLLKSACIASLPVAMPALLLAPTVARWFLLLAARQPGARPAGLGDEFRQSLDPAAIVRATFVPLVLLVVFPVWQSVLTVLVSLLVTFLLLNAAQRRLGGVTGDVYGMVVEVCEVAVLVTWCV